VTQADHVALSTARLDCLAYANAVHETVRDWLPTLGDALRLAGRAATSNVAVTLDVTPGVPHVFQGFAAGLDEKDAVIGVTRGAIDTLKRQQLRACPPRLTLPRRRSRRDCP